jgi:hypothetical protein
VGSETQSTLAISLHDIDHSRSSFMQAIMTVSTERCSVKGLWKSKTFANDARPTGDGFQGGIPRQAIPRCHVPPGDVPADVEIEEWRPLSQFGITGSG